MLIYIIFTLTLGMTCVNHSMETPSKRAKTISPQAIFEQFDKNPLDEAYLEKLINELKGQQDIHIRHFRKPLTPDTSDTLLLKAVRSGSFKLVKALLEIPQCKTSINVVNTTTKHPPLAVAIQSFNNRIVQLLIEHSANINQQIPDNNSMVSLVSYARLIGNIEALRLLLSANANFEPFRSVQVIDKTTIKLPRDARAMLLDGISETNFAAFSSGYIQLNACIDRPCTDLDEATTNLMLAFAQGKLEIFKRLLADVNYQQALFKEDADGRTLFTLAHKLIFDNTRTRAIFETNTLLPLWKSEALLICKRAYKWMVVFFNKLATHQGGWLPYDIRFFILSLVIGSPLIDFTKSPQP